ncbi:hypothetical protein TSAR_010109 [Trichomalopsis sarcophagae]|uniref:Cuticle protein 6 n=1 Tax=Trichomalopsis sarcophagae TaxID=543379 RepID=A0A232EGW3_9HYME|nr:hypothetical protein TSAR_010109 [Trichomalopsis sarcophagae]
MAIRDKNGYEFKFQIPLWFCLLAGSQAKPPLFLSYQDSIGQYSFGYSDPMSARSEYRASDGVTRGTYSYIDNQGLIQTAEYEAGKDLGFRIRATNLPEAPLPVMETPEVREERDRHLKLLSEAEMREGKSWMDDEKMDESMPVVEATKAEEPMMMEKKANAPMIVSKIAEMPEERKVMPEPKTPMEKESIDMPRKEMMKEEMPKTETKPELMPRTSAEEMPASPSMLPEPVQYTPEVKAAREAHFRAYENAARLAAESDLNPQLLEQLLRGHPGSTVTLPLSENKLEIPAPKTAEKPVDMAATARRIEAQPKIAEVETKKMESAEEMRKPVELTETAENVKIGSGITPADTSLRVMDTRLPTLNEFEQTKLKAGHYSTPIEISHISPTNVLPTLYPQFLGSITLKCETGLKVMELDQLKEDLRLLITKPIEFVRFVPGFMQKISTPMVKNWAFQYIYL